MKFIPSILLIIAIIGCGPTVGAASDSESSEKAPFSWSQFWQDFKQDWIKVGKDAKDAGTEAGHTIKNEFQELPDNMREGFQKAKEDFKNIGDGSAEPPSDRPETGKR